MSDSSWLGRLANLNVSRSQSRGPAPHKPLMLLTVIDLVEAGAIGAGGWVAYEVGLVSRFRDYWELVLDRQRNAPDIPMPFHALGGERDQVWERFTEEGAPSRAKATTRLCRLDPRLRALLEDPAFRQPPTARRSQIRARPQHRPIQKSEINNHQSSIQRLSETASHDHSITPSLHHSITPSLHHSITPPLQPLVRVAKGRFQEGSLSGRTLLAHEGKPLVFHPQARLRPGAEFLGWHGGKCFLGAA